MSLDQAASLSQIATFVVIAATAVIGFVQLRHLRNANRVEFMRGLSQDYEGPERREAFQFVRSELADRLEDPSFRKELRSGQWDRSKHPEMSFLNLFETWGRYYREGVVAREPFIASFCRVVTGFWDLLSAGRGAGRRAHGRREPCVWELRIPHRAGTRVDGRTPARRLPRGRSAPSNHRSMG